MSPHDVHALTSRLADDPSDYQTRLAYADLLAESGAEASSLLERSAAWRWMWAVELSAWRLYYVSGHGPMEQLTAHFLLAPPTPEDQSRLNWVELGYASEGNEVMQPPGAVRLAFRSPGHDVPADHRRFRRRSVRQINGGICAWLLPTEFGGEGVTPGEEVPAGASLVTFCTAVERAGGWWCPVAGWRVPEV